MVALAVVWAVGLVAGSCGGADAFGCQSDESCSGGQCQSGYCAFPDSACASGLRWGSLSEEFSDMCVPPPDGTSTSAEPSASTTTSGGTSGDTTLGPGVVTGSSGAVDETSTTDGTSTTTTTGAESSGDSSGGQNLHPDLLSWWQLDERNGDVAFDAGPLANAGLRSGGTEWVPGQLDGGLSFDGIDGEVQIAPNDAYALTDAVTLAAWVYVVAPATVANPGFIYRDGSYELRLGGGTLNPEMFIRDPDSNEANAFGNVECPGPELVPMTWTHVAGTYDVADRTLRLYLDGVEVCASTTTGGDGSLTSPPNADVYLGRRGVTDASYFNGILDDARIYSSALTPAEIAALAAAP